MTGVHDPAERDPYDAAYEQGYADGLDASVPFYPEDDTEINYRDGYRDGRFKRDQESS